VLRTEVKNSSKIKELPETSTFSGNAEEAVEIALQELRSEINEERRIIIILEGPGLQSGRIRRKCLEQKGLLIEDITSQNAIEEINADMSEMKVERLLKRSYGVRSRAVFLEGAHDNLRKKSFEGKDWCDNVIWWLAYCQNIARSITVNYMSQLLYINASHPLVFQRFNVPIFMRYNVSSNSIYLLGIFLARPLELS